MTKTLRNNHLRTSMTVRAAILSLVVSVAAFGCTTNQFRTAGEPASLSPAGGSVTPGVTTTPGSAGPSVPTMISSAVDPAVDAIAVLAANRGFEGRVLGPAAPGTGETSLSMQIATGQSIPPAMLANPQLTVNSSISSPPIPAIVSGAGEGAVVADGGFVAGVTVPGVVGTVGNAGVVADSNANFGATGVSNTTATGLTTVTSPATNIATGTNQVVSTGVAAAPAPSGNVLATPTLGTLPRLNVDLTAAAPGVADVVRPLTVNPTDTRSRIAANTTVGSLAGTRGRVALNTSPLPAANGSDVRVTNTRGRIVITNQGN